MALNQGDIGNPITNEGRRVAPAQNEGLGLGPYLKALETTFESRAMTPPAGAAGGVRRVQLAYIRTPRKRRASAKPDPDFRSFEGTAKHTVRPGHVKKPWRF